uniref:Protein disulfide-isomerase n=2 Tax=Falco TaxID=8952 RepID=A0A8C4UUR6_FALTI
MSEILGGAAVIAAARSSRPPAPAGRPCARRAAGLAPGTGDGRGRKSSPWLRDVAEPRVQRGPARANQCRPGSGRGPTEAQRGPEAAAAAPHLPPRPERWPNRGAGNGAAGSPQLAPPTPAGSSLAGAGVTHGVAPNGELPHGRSGWGGWDFRPAAPGARSAAAAAEERAPRRAAPPAMSAPRPRPAALLLLPLLAFAARASDVVELSDADFESGLAERPGLVLVEFFAPWCGHCKRLAPEYESAATRLKGIVPLVKVDCTANSNTCNKYGVSGYPTLKIFRDGEEAGTYDGPRTADGIVSHLKKQAGPASVALNSVAEFEKFIGDKDASVVGFFGDASGDAYSEFMKAANNLRDNYRFAHTSEDQLVQKYEEDGEGIVLFRPPRLTNKFEDSSIKYTEDKITSGKIKKFIQENIFGICPHMTEDNKDLIQGKDLLVAYYDVDYEKNAKGSNYWRNRVMMIAKKFLDAGHKLSFAVASRKTFGHELSEFGLESSVGEAPVVAIRTAKGDKYVMQEEFSRDGKALERFLQDYFDGNLKKYLKSEPVPESNDGPVKVVVAENFDEIVNAEDKDVLIEFYAPWCGHCKNLEPKYKELGEKLSKDPNIIIAKMDATANDVPSPYEVRGFPTIYFAPAGKKQSPKKYEGGREVSDFISYLKREATNTPVLQEEDKTKKSKKKAKEDL